MAAFSSDSSWMNAASALRGQNRVPVEVATDGAARYSRAASPNASLVRVMANDPVAALRQSLDASLTWWGMAKLPIAWATGQIGDWFDEYVYTAQVEAAFTKVKPVVAWLHTADYVVGNAYNIAEAIAIGFGKSWGVKPTSTVVYSLARSRAMRTAAVAFGRALLATTQGVFRTAAARIGAATARHYAALAAGPTPLGVVANGVLVVVDAAMVLDCATDLIRLRVDLIDNICALFGAREVDRRSPWNYFSQEVLNAHIDS